jgi:hypothetical protein
MSQMSGRQCWLAREDQSSTDEMQQGQTDLLYWLCWQVHRYEDRQPNTLLTNICAAEEQLKLNDCYYEKKDWRVCKKEVSR